MKVLNEKYFRMKTLYLRNARAFDSGRSDVSVAEKGHHVLTMVDGTDSIGVAEIL